MTIRTREEAAQVAENTHTNHIGWCQAVVRGYFNAPSAGDVDGDGAADAEDGWKREPSWAKHTDRRPPRGVPLSFLGGSHDNGHRAISLGHGLVRSTDFSSRTRSYASGVVGTGTIDEVAHAMGVTYAGWSETIDGYKIPQPKATRGWRIDSALRRLRAARDHAPEGSARRKFLQRSIDALRKIPFLNR